MNPNQSKMNLSKKEQIKELNNEAVRLSNQCNNYTKAIFHLQRAMILCKMAELFPNSSSNYSIASSECSSTDDETSDTNASLSKTNMIDEGMYSYARTLAIDDTILELQDTASFHSLEAILCFNLGVCYLRDNQDQEAALYFSKSEERLLTKSFICTSHDFSEAILGEVATEPFKVDSISLLHNIGLLKFRAAQYVESLRCYTEAMKISMTKYLGDQILLAVALNSIGVVLTYMYEQTPLQDDEVTVNSTDAITAFQQSIIARTEILGEADVNIATTYNNLGRIHFLLDNIESALEQHLKAYSIRKNILGDHDSNTGVAAFNVGKCFHRLRQKQQAFKYFSLYVNSNLGSNNEYNLTEEVIMAFTNIAECFQDFDDLELASSFFELALTSARKLFGEKNAFTAQILNRQGNMFFAFEQLDGSLNSYLEGLEVETVIYPHQHPNIATTKGNIQRVVAFKNIVENNDRRRKLK
jgi:tetratricopeptide (TPR) repeat protein